MQQTLANALTKAVALNAKSVAMPTLATGYGPLSIELFGKATADLLATQTFALDALLIVVRSEDNAITLNDALKTDGK